MTTQKFMVSYSTENDTYTKEFSDLAEAKKFVEFLDKRYPHTKHQVVEDVEDDFCGFMIAR